MQANWDQLTPDQQAVISPYLEPGPNDTVITIDLSSATGTTVSGRMASTRAFEVTAARAQMPTRNRSHAAPADAPSAEFQQVARDELFSAIRHIGQRLGMPTITEGPIPNVWRYVTLTFSEMDGGNTAWNTGANTKTSGLYAPCDVVMYRNAWQGAQANGGVLPDVLHAQLTHEVVHCYQNVIWGSTPVAKSAPSWMPAVRPQAVGPGLPGDLYRPR